MLNFTQKTNKVEEIVHNMRLGRIVTTDTISDYRFKKLNKLFEIGINQPLTIYLFSNQEGVLCGTDKDTNDMLDFMRKKSQMLEEEDKDFYTLNKYFESNISLHVSDPINRSSVDERVAIFKGVVK